MMADCGVNSVVEDELENQVVRLALGDDEVFLQRKILFKPNNGIPSNNLLYFLSTQPIYKNVTFTRGCLFKIPLNSSIFPAGNTRAPAGKITP